MKETAAEKKQRLIKLIHVGKGKLKIDDDSYRDLLRAETGCVSTKAMTVVQLESVLQRLRRDGFKVQHKTANGNSRAIDRDAQSQKIRALWLEMHAAGKVRDQSEKALCAWVQRVTGVAALQWLSGEQASQVIEMLKKWSAR
jgi:phage gp16-like protein